MINNLDVNHRVAFIYLTWSFKYTHDHDARVEKTNNKSNI